MEVFSEADNKKLIERNHWLETKVRELEEVIKILASENAQLKFKLNQDSSNSNRPPSSDPVYKKRTKPQRKPSKLKKGAQPGHPGHQREMLPPTVEQMIPPQVCDCGCHHFENLETYHTHQVIELPEIKLNVQHYHLQQGTCQSCGRSQKAQLPNEIQAGYGPRFTALTAELSGPMRNSRTEVKRFYQSVFDIKISRGGVQKCVDRASKALRPIWDHFGQLSQKTAVNHIDETAWKQSGKLKWNWAMENKHVSFFMIHDHRSMEAFKQLIGDFKGIIISDDYGVYIRWEHGRQTCLAHLVRTINGLVDFYQGGRKKEAKIILKMLQQLFQWAKAPPDEQQLELWFRKLYNWIERNRGQKDDLARFAHRLENDRLNLTLFLSHDDVEPTNNNAERAIRFLVLWRKIQMGTDSHKGNRWVERVASMVGTCRKLKLSTFGVLTNAISSLFHQQDPDLTPFDQPRLVS